MKVSVLMITYNHEKFIAQAIDSILMQKVNFDYEIVIGEDCSTDNTRQIVIDYQKKSPDKIRLLLPEKNLGMHINLINTYKACQGKYIAVLEGDDYWISSDKLKKQVDFLDNNSDFSICFNNSLVFWEDEHRDPAIFLHNQSKISTLDNLLTRNFISTPSVMYRGGLIKNFPNWYYEQGMGDWTFHILNAQYGKIGYIDEVMSAYRVHETGVWSSKSREYQLKETIKMLNNINKHFKYRYKIIINNAINYYSEQLENLRKGHQQYSNNFKKSKTKLQSKNIVVNDVCTLLTANQVKSHKLHIGCGNIKFEGWINIDIEPNNLVADLICDASKKLPFDRNSCNLIYSEHFLEHLTVEEGLFFLKECYRVLQPGGILRIAMPSLEYIIEKYNSEDWQNQDWLKWSDYQFVKTRAEMLNIAFRWWGHKWLYDKEELNRRFSEVGYVNIREFAWGKSKIPELENRETREDSLLVFEAEVPSKSLQSYPLVSVCIPTFNSEKFITEALNSVLKQTYSNIEIILSDDNSTDKTVEIAKSLKQKLSFDFSILEHNQYGLAQNWNFCISQAQGKYIKFLFQDDLLEPNAIEEMVNLAEQDKEVGLVFSPRKLFSNSGDANYDSNFLRHHEAKDVHKAWSRLQSLQSGQELLQDLNILENPINKIGEPSTVLIRKEVFERVGLFNPEFCQLVDLEMWLRIMSQYKVGFVDKLLSHFRIHPQQQTRHNAASKEAIFSDYQKLFHTIYSDSRYPQLTRQQAFCRYAILSEQDADLRESRKQLAEQWLSIPDNQLEDMYQGMLGKTHKILLDSGIKYTNLADDEQIFVNDLVSYLSQGFEQPKAIQYLLAAMLYCRPDQLPLQHDFPCIPVWFIKDYLQFLFSSPIHFRELGETDNYYNYMQGWLDYLHASIFDNLDSPLFQEVVNTFAQIANFIPVYFNESNLKDIYVKRAEIIEHFLKLNEYGIDYEFPARPVNRKKIRLGILATHFTPGSETFAYLHVYEYLSRDFEVILYSLKQTGHPLEEYCRSCANSFKPLPQNLSEQVNIIRADDLDILFIATNVTAVTNQICLLASHRLARIQVTSGGSVVTTGMRHMDYYISGTLTDPSPTAPEHYREKLVKLEGTAHCFSYGCEEEKATAEVDRKNLGISEEAVIFISGANFFKIVPELIHTWAKIIAELPNSVLVLLPFGLNWSNSYPKKAFENNLNKVFSQYGISTERLMILDPQPVPNREDVKEYFKIADIYLDSYPFSGTTSLIEPLQVNLPVISRQGHTFRSAMGAAMVRSLDLPDLVADSEETYIQLAVKLATNPELRKQKSDRIFQKMQQNPSFLDSRSYSAQMGALFQQLFQQYQANNLIDRLGLRDINLVMFPDWHQSEESLYEDFVNVLKTMSSNPDKSRITLLIDTDGIDGEDANWLFSSIAMNILMEEAVDIADELEVSLLDDLTENEWQLLLSLLQGRISLDNENQNAIAKAKAQSLKVYS